jgi:hypothetical protein
MGQTYGFFPSRRAKSVIFARAALPNIGEELD